MTKPRLWTRDFFIVSALNFLLVLVFYLLMVVVGLHAIRAYQASVSQAGLVAGMFIVGVLAGRLFIGQVMGRIGRKRSMLVGLALGVVACLLYLVEAGIGVLIATRLLHGFSVGIAATTIATVVAYLVPVSRSGEGIGYFSMSSSLATAIGPFIGIFMMQHGEFRMILWLCALLAVGCFLVGLCLTVPEVERGRAPPAKAGLSLAGLMEPRVVPLCGLVFVLCVFYSSVLSFLNVYADERSLGEAASLFFLVYAITLLVSRPIAGRLLDNRGASLVMYPCFLLMAAGMVTLGLAGSGWLLLLASFLMALGFGNIQSTTQALVIKMVEPERLGLATSTFFIFVDSGLGFGPYLLGLLIPHLGLANLYVVLGVLSLFGAVGYRAVHGRKGGVIPS